MITSTSNEKIKNVVLLTKKSKARKEQGLFVVDGERAVFEIPYESIAQLYYCGDRLSAKGNAFVEGFKSFLITAEGLLEEVSDNVMSVMSDTKTPQGIIAVVKMPDFSLEDIIKTNDKYKPFVLLLENLQDPGNLGTIFRTAEGAGATGIIMSQDTVDVYSPKVVRATMGNILRMPHIYTDDFYGTIEILKASGIKLYAAHLDNSVEYNKADYKDAVGFMIGNEGNGLKRETADMADSYIKIPMHGKLESLNAAIAAAVLMYECLRQRDE